MELSLIHILAINLTSTTADEIEFRLRSNRDKYLSLVCNLKKGELIFDRSRSDSASKIVRCCPLRSVMDSILYLHIYLDTSSIEVFTDHYLSLIHISTILVPSVLL